MKMIVSTIPRGKIIPGGHIGSPLQKARVGATLCGRPLIRLLIRPVRSFLLFALLFTLLIGAPTNTPIHAQSAGITPPAPTAQAFGKVATPLPIPVSADLINAIAHNLYCPVCANTPLDVCPTAACIRWRAQIGDLIGEGDTETQIRQYFIDHFGMRVVAIPTDPASQAITLGLPYAAIALAGILILWQLWRWRRVRPRMSPSSAIGSEFPVEPAVDDEYRSRFEAEVKDE